MAENNQTSENTSKDSKSKNGNKSNDANGEAGKNSHSDSNGGVRSRTSTQCSQHTTSPSRPQASSHLPRRSSSPLRHKLLPSNVKSRQSRTGNRSNVAAASGDRAHINNAHGVAAFVSANVAHTRNHSRQSAQQNEPAAQPVQDEAVTTSDSSDDAAVAVDVINPISQQEDVHTDPIPQIVSNPSPPYNWQATKKTLKERMKFMFNNDIMTDVFFIVGKGANSQRIPAHKFILSTGSAVFDAMFNSAMASTSQEEEIPDVEPAAFLALLRFLYSDEVLIGPETVMTTLYAAKKYVVPALESACVDFLKQNLSSDNAFMLLTQARLFDEPQLAALCLETIDKSTTEALAAEGFTDIDLDTLCVVLERDTLGIRECKLFTSVCRWAEADCVKQNLIINNDNKRQCLGNAIALIRFPLMTVEEFAQGAAQCGILSDREVVQLFLYFTVNPKPQVMIG